MSAVQLTHSCQSQSNRRVFVGGDREVLYLQSPHNSVYLFILWFVLNQSSLAESSEEIIFPSWLQNLNFFSFTGKWAWLWTALALFPSGPCSCGRGVDLDSPRQLDDSCFAGVMVLSVCVVRKMVSVCFPSPRLGALDLVALSVWFKGRL